MLKEYDEFIKSGSPQTPSAGKARLFINEAGVLSVRDDTGIDAEYPSGGDVNGPASAVDGNVVLFDGVTGKLLKDSGLALSGSNTGDEVQATEVLAGIAEIATQVEADAGADDTKMITPLKMANYSGFTATPAATEELAGKAEIATTAETLAGTDDARFVTPAKHAAFPDHHVLETTSKVGVYNIDMNGAAVRDITVTGGTVFAIANASAGKSKKVELYLTAGLATNWIFDPSWSWVGARPAADTQAVLLDEQYKLTVTAIGASKVVAELEALDIV